MQQQNQQPVTKNDFTYLTITIAENNFLYQGIFYNLFFIVFYFSKLKGFEPLNFPNK